MAKSCEHMSEDNLCPEDAPGGRNFQDLLESIDVACPALYKVKGALRELTTTFLLYRLVERGDDGEFHLTFDEVEALTKEVDQLHLQECYKVLSADKIKRHAVPLPANASVVMEPDECAMCISAYRNLERIYTLGCGHKYHYACLLRWTASPNFNGTCPICRGKIPAARRLINFEDLPASLRDAIESLSEGDAARPDVDP